MTGETIYVDDSVWPPDGEGASWEDAYTYLQDALAAATDGDEIRVAGGNYRPDADAANQLGTGDRCATFLLISGVSIKGGYAGLDYPDDPDHRDIVEFKSFLTGDINAPGYNSYHVVTGTGTDSTAVLDGFTITAGQADGTAPPDDGGGGMYSMSPSSPTIIDCTFHDNFAYTGGGGMHNAGTPMIINCRFLNNTALHGGGMSNDLCGANPTLTNCIFTANTATNGGAMYNLCGNPVLANCTFSLNEAADDGGGIHTGTSDPTLTNCIFWGNSDSGGTDESGQIHVITGSPVINYTVIEGWTGSLGGTGNSGNDPLFIDADGGDGEPGTPDDNLRLSPGSPCRDAGDSTGLPPDVADLDDDGDTAEPIPYDLDGKARFVDDLAVLDIGVPEPPIVDMGVYEATSRVLLVDDDATGTGDGTTWADAFTSLQDALGTARDLDCTSQSPCQIWVAAGTYTPDRGNDYTLGDKGASFSLFNNLTIYGGFSTCDSSRQRCVGGPDDGDSCSTDEHCEDGTCEDVRDFIYNETILSGDLAGDDEITDCVFEPGHECYNEGGYCDSDDVCREIGTGRILTRNLDNTKNVVTVPYGSERRYTHLDGFTITGGNATGAGGGDPPEPGGGGIRFVGGQATIRNCTIKVNQAENGGGGIYSYGELDSHIVNCLITENWAGHGGGVAAKVTASPVFVNCIIVANRAVYVAGGLHLETWEPSNPRIYNTVIARNFVTPSGGRGGGLTFWVDQDVLSTLSIANSTIAQNAAQDQGGGLHVRGDQGARVEIVNSIVWANEAGYGQQVYIESLGGTGPWVEFKYSNVRQFETNDIYGDVDPILGPGNIGTEEAHEPRFVDPDDTSPWEENDFALLSWSPGIDAADNDLIPPDVVDLDEDGDISEPTPLELLGRLRQADDEGITDTGNGTVPIVDMGAYEFPCRSLAAPTAEIQACPGEGEECTCPPPNPPHCLCPWPDEPPDGHCQDGVCTCTDDSDCRGQMCVDGICYTAKNRYISFVPGNSGTQTALIVKAKDLMPPFDVDNGKVMFVGAPEEICEIGGAVYPPCPPGHDRTFMTATLLCPQSVYSTDWGAHGLIHLYFCGIVPYSVYEVQAWQPGCKVTRTALWNTSPALTVTTSIWGDVVSGKNCQASFDRWDPPDGTVTVVADVTAVLDKFKNLPGAPIKARADVDPDTPNQRIDISDVTWVLEAFREIMPYPFWGFFGCD